MIVHAEDAAVLDAAPAPPEPCVRRLPAQPARRRRDHRDRPGARRRPRDRRAGARPAPLQRPGARPDRRRPRRGAAGHGRDLPALPLLRSRDDPRRGAAVQVLPADPRRRQPRRAVAGAARRGHRHDRQRPLPRHRPRRSSAATATSSRPGAGSPASRSASPPSPTRPRRRGIGLEPVSRWMSRNTADLVGLAGKGRIAVGADADLAVYDPTVDVQVEAARAGPPQPDLGVRRAPATPAGSPAPCVRGNAVDRQRPDHGWGQPLLRDEVAA